MSYQSIGSLPSNVERVAAGVLTWLSLVLAPWLGGGAALLFSLLAMMLLLFGLGAMVFYVVLSTREVRGLRRAVGALLLLTALVSIEWAAVQTAVQGAEEILAASRSPTVTYRVSVAPMPWAIGGLMMFFVGMKLSGRGRHLAWVVSETAAFGLVCPAVAYLVQLNALPLSA